jgi:hypothetical protein
MARAQQQMTVTGFLHPQSPEEYAEPMRQAMSKPKRKRAICAKWPPPMRAALRTAITSIRPHQWVSDDRFVAFFTIIATHSRVSDQPRYHQGDRS